MAFTFTNDSASISTTEYSIVDKTTTGVPIAHTDDGVYQLFLDLSNLAAGDLFRFRIYEKYASAGTARIVFEWFAAGVQSLPIYTTPSLVLGEGWDMTATRMAGSDRTILWSIRKLA